MGIDLPLNVHPAAIRASAVDTLLGADRALDRAPGCGDSRVCTQSAQCVARQGVGVDRGAPSRRSTQPSTSQSSRYSSVSHQFDGAVVRSTRLCEIRLCAERKVGHC
jgi:hypothetical protein